MKKEISVYELLGLIKDGKAPKKIKYENIIWKHNLEENEYIEDGKDCWLFQDYFPNNLNFLDCLKDKVEIINCEKDKPIIEKIEIKKYNFHNDNHSKLLKNQEQLSNKLNEVIEFLNRKEDK